uniref:Uncharacterized protein n=1 Tax=Arundo donax TaxID=35708 RepID=A0A0A8YQT1_ARUDO
MTILFFFRSFVRSRRRVCVEPVLYFLEI